MTVPAGTDKTAVQTAPFRGADGTNTLAGEYGTICGQPADIQPTEGAVYYTLGGWPVGSRHVSVSPLNLNLTSAWQVSVSVTLKADEGETGDKQEAAQLTNEKVWQNVSSYVQNLDQRRLSFWETHKTAIPHPDSAGSLHTELPFEEKDASGAGGGQKEGAGDRGKDNCRD